VSKSLTLDSIKARWNDVLDELLRVDRILWLSFFDARLTSYSDGILTLDFQDSQKFASEHDFSAMRKEEQIAKVTRIAQNILQAPLVIAIQ
jgi:hypothetical protein